MSVEALLAKAKVEHGFDPSDASWCVMCEVIAALEERLRVNVGLVAENKDLRVKLGEAEKSDEKGAS